MKPLLSNNLHKLCSQTAWWSTFFWAILYGYTWYGCFMNLNMSTNIKMTSVTAWSRTVESCGDGHWTNGCDNVADHRCTGTSHLLNVRYNDPLKMSLQLRLYRSHDPTNSVTALGQVNEGNGQSHQARLSEKCSKECSNKWNIYSIMKAEDTEVLKRQRAKSNKIKARYNWPTCKNCSDHCAPL